jgi:fatty acid-binding protein DegV
MLNIKPILTLDDGKIVPAARARGTKKAIAELIGRIKTHSAEHPGPLVLDFMHAQAPEAAETLKRAVSRTRASSSRTASVYEIGSVIAAHVGPGTFGFYAHVRP